MMSDAAHGALVSTRLARGGRGWVCVALPGVHTTNASRSRRDLTAPGGERERVVDIGTEVRKRDFREERSWDLFEQSKGFSFRRPD